MHLGVSKEKQTDGELTKNIKQIRLQSNNSDVVTKDKQDRVTTDVYAPPTRNNNPRIKQYNTHNILLLLYYKRMIRSNVYKSTLNDIL